MTMASEVERLRDENATLRARWRAGVRERNEQAEDKRVLHATVAAVRALHVRVERWRGAGEFVCEECAGLCHSASGLGCDGPDGAWPCATIMALDPIPTPGNAWLNSMRGRVR